MYSVINGGYRIHNKFKEIKRENWIRGLLQLMEDQASNPLKNVENRQKVRFTRKQSTKQCPSPNSTEKISRIRIFFRVKRKKCI